MPDPRILTQRRRRTTPAPDRFWKKVNKAGPLPVARPELGECWLWTAYLDKKGYGRFARDTNHRNYGAHRWVYENEVGPIPGGLVIDHLCRVRHCVNPSHLEPVTTGTNTLRGTGPMARNARKTACTHGHPFDEANTYTDSRGTRHCRTCCRIRAADGRRRRILVGASA